MVAASSDTLPWLANGTIASDYGALPATSASHPDAAPARVQSLPSGRINVTVVAWDRLSQREGHGLVAGVEVSFDGGARWHPASRVPKPWPPNIAAQLPDTPPGAESDSATLWSLQWGSTMHDWLHANVSSFTSTCRCAIADGPPGHNPQPCGRACVGADDCPVPQTLKPLHNPELDSAMDPDTAQTNDVDIAMDGGPATSDERYAHVNCEPGYGIAPISRAVDDSLNLEERATLGSRTFGPEDRN